MSGHYYSPVHSFCRRRVCCFSFPLFKPRAQCLSRRCCCCQSPSYFHRELSRSTSDKVVVVVVVGSCVVGGGTRVTLLIREGKEHFKMLARSLHVMFWCYCSFNCCCCCCCCYYCCSSSIFHHFSRYGRIIEVMLIQFFCELFRMCSILLMLVYMHTGVSRCNDTMGPEQICRHI